jgi:two-component sensor histidine kinase
MDELELANLCHLIEDQIIENKLNPSFDILYKRIKNFEVKDLKASYSSSDLFDFSQSIKKKLTIQSQKIELKYKLFVSLRKVLHELIKNSISHKETENLEIKIILNKDYFEYRDFGQPKLNNGVSIYQGRGKGLEQIRQICLENDLKIKEIELGHIKIDLNV